jgi:hypothetical protein
MTGVLPASGCSVPAFSADRPDILRAEDPDDRPWAAVIPGGGRLLFDHARSVPEADMATSSK